MTARRLQASMRNERGPGGVSNSVTRRISPTHPALAPIVAQLEARYKTAERGMSVACARRTWTGLDRTLGKRENGH